ncbi:hypothetical protein B0H11DRAFT_1898390 [Mycena galericulata]|nr:hypothetical protein B0H11DRAFT_1898390 [Mycena galericulata]
MSRASDLRTHQNVHAGEERVRANLLRHSAMHQILKTVSDRSTPRLTFAPPEKVPHVYSDTVPMHAGIAWDNEGPWTRRETQWFLKYTFGAYLSSTHSRIQLNLSKWTTT